MLVLALVGCASNGAGDSFPTARPLGRDLLANNAIVSQGAASQGQWSELSEPTNTLDLRQALALALRRNPELPAFGWDVRAAEARELQAGLWPNPEAAVDFENVGGSLQGFRDSETTITLA